MEQIVVLNSQNRIIGSDDPGNCTVPLPELVSPTGVKEIELLSFSIPNTLYNIRTGENDMMVWNRELQNFSYQIPAGAYTISALLFQIQAGMNDEDGNSYTLTYVQNTFRVRIEGSGGFNLNWESNPDGASGCYKELGFAYADTTSGNTHTGPYAVSLYRPLSLLIEIPEIPSGAKVITSERGVRASFIVPLLENSGALCYHASGDYEQKLCWSRSIVIPKQLTVRLKTANGRVVRTNGSDWEIVLRVKMLEP